MKRFCYISVLLCIALLHINAQVQVVGWSKATNDTMRMAGPNWGILSKFLTFPDGSKFITATNFFAFPNIADTLKYVEFADSSAKMASREFVRLYFPNVADTLKYLEKPDSSVMPGYATRTMLGKDSTYARAIFALDTTYKAAQLLLRIKYADSTNSPGYVTRTQFRSDSVYARAIFALDTTYKATQLLTRIPYSDTTSVLVKQWIFVRDSLYRAAQEALKVTKVDSAAMPGYVTRTSFANDSTYARAIFARDTTYKAAQLLQRIKYSDTTAFPSIVPARDGQQGWFKRNATAPRSGMISLATATDTLSAATAFFSGNVGIGTTAPVDKLSIYSSTNNQGLTVDNVGKTTITLKSGGTVYGYIGIAGNTNDFFTGTVAGDEIVRVQSPNKLFFGQGSAAPTMVIDSGKVGIGTTAPNYKLSLGNNLANTKLALWDDGAGVSYGLGVQNNEFRFSLANSVADFRFYNSEAGSLLVTIKGTGNVGIGTTTPLHKQSTVSAIATNLSAFNFVDSDININRTTVAQTTDTSSVNLSFTSTGEPIFSLIGKTGTVNFRSDSSGARFNGLADFQGANSATVTAGAGDSIQVSVTGVTITSQIVTAYAAATALTDIPTGTTNKQTGKFTIRATNGKDVTYWISKK